MSASFYQTRPISKYATDLQRVLLQNHGAPVHAVTIVTNGLCHSFLAIVRTKQRAVDSSHGITFYDLCIYVGVRAPHPPTHWHARVCVVSVESSRGAVKRMAASVVSDRWHVVAADIPSCRLVCGGDR